MVSKPDQPLFTPTRRGGAAAADSPQHLAESTASDSASAQQMLPLVYDELRRLAAARIGREPGGQTLQPTALVHEAYLRIVGEAEAGSAHWSGKAHFFGAAALAMRRILIERARLKQRRRRLAERRPLTLDHSQIAPDEQFEDLIALDGALDRLHAMDQRKAQIVMLRFFAGLTIEQAAEAMGLSRTTVNEEWAFARAWLHSEMGGDDSPSEARDSAETGRST
jgi:RNA polymerase sigma factor (TIGR02999 family)